MSGFSKYRLKVQMIVFGRKSMFYAMNKGDFRKSICFEKKAFFRKTYFQKGVSQKGLFSESVFSERPICLKINFWRYDYYQNGNFLKLDKSKIKIK